MTSIVYAAWLATVVVFLGLPLWLTLVRGLWPRLMPIWAAVGISVCGGWMLANAQVHLRQAYLTRLVHAMPNPSDLDPIVQEWVADGAKMLFAAMLGWLYVPVLWVVWCPVVVPLAVFLRRGVPRPESPSERWLNT